MFSTNFKARHALQSCGRPSPAHSSSKSAATQSALVKIAKSGFEDLLASGVVLTGGATILEGTAELAEEVLGLPARRGTPHGIGGLVDVVRSAAYATPVGLVLYGARQQRVRGLRPSDGAGVWGKLRTWFKEVF